MTKEKECLTFLKIINDYFKADMNKTQIEIYVEELTSHEIDYSKLTKSVLTQVDLREGFPSIKKLLYLAGIANNYSLENKAQSLIESTTIKARKIGQYNFVKFQRVATENEMSLVRSMGGWSTFCTMDMSNPAIIKRVRDSAQLLVQGENYERGEQLNLLNENTGNEKLDQQIKKLSQQKEIK